MAPLLSCTLLLCLTAVLCQDTGECPPGTPCEFEKCSTLGKRSTCCRCEEWFVDGSCAPAGWRRVNGTGTCDFDVSAPPPGSCLPGIQCDGFKCANRDDPDTCCDCKEWKPDGSCTKRGWIPRAQGGDCSFVVSPKRKKSIFEKRTKPREKTPSPFRAVGVPVGEGAAETEDRDPPFVKPGKLQPCPEGVQCDTIQCAIKRKKQVCCECLVRRADGICDKNGWFLLDTTDKACPLVKRRG